MKKISLVLCFMLFCFANSVFAAHPLITDDTGTQGKRNSQIEINSEYNYDKETEEGVTTKETRSEAAAVFSYGITDTADIVLGLPYQWKKVKEDSEITSDVNGISDISLEIKWRFYENDSFSLALKPSISFPTGDEDKGLGNGRTSYGLMFITTKVLEPLAFHLNVGYMRNEYKLETDEDANRKDIWHASLAMEIEVVENLRLVANIGAEKNPDKTSNTDPGFILGGLIYSVTENFDIDFGVKGGLNKPETDYSILVGIAVRF